MGGGGLRTAFYSKERKKPPEGIFFFFWRRKKKNHFLYVIRHFFIDCNNLKKPFEHSFNVFSQFFSKSTVHLTPPPRKKSERSTKEVRNTGFGVTPTMVPW